MNSDIDLLVIARDEVVDLAAPESERTREFLDRIGPEAVGVWPPEEAGPA